VRAPRTIHALSLLWLAWPAVASAQVPPAPTLVAPAAGTTVYSANPTYTWNVSSGATSYTLNVRDNSSTLLTITYTASSVCSGSTCSVTPTQGHSNANYYWKVRGINGSGNGPWSTEVSFSAVPPNWNAGSACTGVFLTGDFNGDGLTDRLCAQGGTVNVSLAATSGFGPAQSWLGAALVKPVIDDFNIDGKTDIAEYNASNGDFKVALSNGGGFASFVSWGIATAGSYTCKTGPVVVGSGDFDGDGQPDVYCKREANGKIVIGRNTGTAFTYSLFTDYECSTGAQIVGSADLDGDGKGDWYCIAPSGQLFTLLSDGAQFVNGVFSGLPNTYCAQDKYLFVDVNGDGRTDAHCPTNGNVGLSTGLSFLDQGAGTGWCLVGNNNVMAGNLDGDGPTELICNNPNAPTNDIEVRKWTGSSLDSPQTWKQEWCSGQAQTGDFDGDGKTDLLCDQVTVATGGTSGLMPDLMVQSNNGLGGTTVVEYTPSTAFPQDNNPGPKHLVTAVTRQDGRGGSSTTTYTYSGGKFDRKEKQFLGYRNTRTNVPCITGEALCPYGEFEFSQDLASPGVLTKSMLYAGSGTLLRKDEYTYTNTTSIPRKSTLTTVDSYEYDMQSGSKHVVASYPSYDAYGNRLQEVITGGVTASDDIQTDWQYSPNLSAYIVGLPGRIERRAPGGSLLVAEEFLYDGAGAWSTPPVKGDLTKHRRWLDTPSQYVARTMGYDSWGNQTSVADETNRTVTTTFDGTDHLFPVSVQNAAGETQTMVWDAACGVVSESTDENSQNTTRQYDPLCRLTQTNGSLGAFEIRSYVDLGNPSLQRIRVETPSAAGISGNLWIESSFDGMGHIYRSERRGPTAGQDIIVDRTYNVRGALESISEPYYSGEAVYFTSFEYDALNRRTAVEHPDGTRLETTLAVSSTIQADENGKETTLHFDDSGHVVLEERSLGGQTVATTSTYDTLGRLVGMTDHLGNNWQWTIDSLGRTTTQSDPDSGNGSFQYDAAGRLLSQTDAKNQTTSFTYDAVGRLASKSSAVGTAVYTRSEPRAGFYNVGRLTTIASPGTILKLDYDAAGRTVKQKRTLDSVDHTFQRRFDAAGRLTGITFPDGDAVGTPGDPWDYDEAGRLASIPGILSSLSYDAAGRPTQQANANGTQTARVYSAERGFVEQILTSVPSGLQDLVYSYDPAGLVTQVASAHANEAWSYGYDDLYRLTSATSLNNPSESQTFNYDVLGRMTYNSKVGNYTYPGPGQPRPHAPATVNGSTYNYDANGNLASGGGLSLTWDAENRLTQAGPGQFVYDAAGERLKKTAPGVTSLYPLGDDYEVTNGVVTKYLSAPGLGVFAKRVGSTTYWLHTDKLGSVQAVTNSTGSEVLRRTYRPYGAKIADTGSHVESRGWIDQRQDSETGLTYLHARYYNSTLGTFLSPDPLGPAGSINAYGYSSGDPINFKDPTGLHQGCPEDDCDRRVEGWGSWGGFLWSAFPGFGGNPNFGGDAAQNSPEPTDPTDPTPDPTDPVDNGQDDPEGCRPNCGDLGDDEDDNHGEDETEETDLNSEGGASQHCTFWSKGVENYQLLNESSLAGLAHLYHYGEVAVGGMATLLGAQAISSGLRGNLPGVVQTGIELGSWALHRVPHVLGGMVVVESGFAVGAGLSAGASVANGTCR
jgi:RHS repeat-associated protein